MGALACFVYVVLFHFLLFDPIFMNIGEFPLRLKLRMMNLYVGMILKVRQMQIHVLLRHMMINRHSLRRLDLSELLQHLFFVFLSLFGDNLPLVV